METTNTIKDVHIDRLKGYFLESTKNLIKSEGIESVTVRSIAEHAGYSFGTLYKHYKDVKELIYFSGLDFMKECEEYIGYENFQTEESDDVVIQKSLKYAEYYIQYDGIFHLFFLSNRISISKLSDFNHEIYAMHKRIFLHNLKSKYGDKAESLLESLVAVLIGSLTLYLNRLYPETYSEFKKILISNLKSINSK
ncbi:MAG: TetR/AcrR family transcriptional regulator [Candidatus Kapaibacterium sp.]|jgi:AcrR family transcriptional regulator|nr:TetR/AcrR family transcriptional regulator [Candidatus Kapabacteria bacterium]